MAYCAVVDACALYPFSLRDTLIRLAAAELYDLFWSERILDEVSRNLVKREVATEEQAERLLQKMRDVFPEAMVADEQITALEGAMTNASKDRHVLAAAVSAGAEAIVTFNLRDFPPEACELHDVEAMHPDDFLMILFGVSSETVVAVLETQASDLRKPCLLYTSPSPRDRG